MTTDQHATTNGPAVFLDRDGTIIDEVGYLDRPERVALYPFTTVAIRALNRAGFRTILVTNQSGIARGFFDEATVDAVHTHIADRLAEGGAYLDAYYYCPHHPDGHVAPYAGRCDCRKPARGLVDRAVRELSIDPARSFAVGDRWLDVQLARNVGARGILVRTGYGAVEESRRPADVVVDAVVNNLVEAVAHILTTAVGPTR